MFIEKFTKIHFPSKAIPMTKSTVLVSNLEYALFPITEMASTKKSILQIG